MQGAASFRDLRRELQVGTCCGKCVPEAKAALSACLAQGKPLASNAFFPIAGAELAV